MSPSQDTSSNDSTNINPVAPGASKYPSDKQQFSTEEAADYIGRSISSMRNHVYKGNIKPSGTYGGMLNNRYWLFDRKDLDDLYYYHCYKGLDQSSK